MPQNLRIYIDEGYIHTRKDHSESQGDSFFQTQKHEK